MVCYGFTCLFPLLEGWICARTQDQTRPPFASSRELLFLAMMECKVGLCPASSASPWPDTLTIPHSAFLMQNAKETFPTRSNKSAYNICLSLANQSTLESVRIDVSANGRADDWPRTYQTHPNHRFHLTTLLWQQEPSSPLCYKYYIQHRNPKTPLSRSNLNDPAKPSQRSFRLPSV